VLPGGQRHFNELISLRVIILLGFTLGFYSE
jgi:hypothetical protein